MYFSNEFQNFAMGSWSNSQTVTAIDKISWAPWQTASEMPCKTHRNLGLSFLPAQRKLVWSLLVAKIHGLTRNFWPIL
jgi:hypothetical protein